MSAIGPCRGTGAGRHLPGASVLLAGLAVVVFLLPGAALRFEYDRGAIAAGQVWRLLTGHWTHWSLDHLVWDTLAALLLGILCERRSRRRFLACLLGSALIISLTLWWLRPDMATYRGLSGLDSALFVLLAVSVMREGAESRTRLAVAAALMIFLAKVAYEIATGSTLFVHGAGANVAAVPLAHLMGAAVGFAVAPTPRLLEADGGLRRRRTEASPCTAHVPCTESRPEPRSAGSDSDGGSGYERLDSPLTRPYSPATAARLTLRKQPANPAGERGPGGRA